MSLRRQLILVSLLLLTLPWAGCQFLREMETALRQGQAQAVAATAAAVAASLAERPDALYPNRDRLRSPDDTSGSLYAPLLESPPLLDGYEDGWSEPVQQTYSGLETRIPSLGYRAGVYADTLYLMLHITDSSVTYHDPGLSPEPNGDRLILRTWLDGKRQDYVIATPAPGSVRAQYASPRHRAVDAGQIRGFWQDTRAGYAVELALPLAITGQRLGVYAVDVDGHRSSGWRTAGNTGPLQQAAPPWLIYPPRALQADLARFAQAGQHLRVTDRHARLLAQAREPKAPGVSAGDDTFWLVQALYRRALAEEALEPRAAPASTGYLHAPEVAAALEGRATQHWYGTDSPGRRLLAGAAPIRSGDQVIGAVIVEQSSDQYLSLTDRAFSRLLGYSALALAVAALGLLLFASVLSWRIRRLSQAARSVLGSQGMELAHFPRSRARDEIGDLSRSYAHLLAELHEYNEYLRTLSRKLSHELRTPIAVIQSSLDNLGTADQADARATYVQRAHQGLSRLSGILDAMTEATRLEESIRQRELARLDLAPLLESLCAAYRGAYPQHSFILHGPEDCAWVHGAADLLVQALDKLVDNAASFAPAGSAITLRLLPHNGYWAISVSNPGPALPADMRGRLFEAMVSLREPRKADTVHLGLGLYVVRLVADYHHGSAHAATRDDGNGAVFTLLLPRDRSPVS